MGLAIRGNIQGKGRRLRIAILSCGPSLNLYPGPDGYDSVITVNRAALKFASDVWCANDWIYEEDGYPLGGVKNLAASVIGNPVLLTGKNSAESLARHGIPWRGETVTIESWWADYQPRTLGWSIFSATTALGYAAHLGAKEIDAFGFDWSGTADADGVVACRNRTDERWKQEREIFEATAGMLKERGVSVVRRVDQS